MDFFPGRFSQVAIQAQQRAGRLERGPVSMSLVMESHSDWRTAQHVRRTDKHCPVGSCGMTESDRSLGNLTEGQAGQPQQAHVPKS